MFVNENLISSGQKILSMEWKQRLSKIAFDSDIFAANKMFLAEDISAPLIFGDICCLRNGPRGRNERTFLNNFQISLGPAYSGAPLHAHVAAYNIVFQGVKKWVSKIYVTSTFTFPFAHIIVPAYLLLKNNSNYLF